MEVYPEGPFYYLQLFDLYKISPRFLLVTRIGDLLECTWHEWMGLETLGIPYDLPGRRAPQRSRGSLRLARRDLEQHGRLAVQERAVDAVIPTF